MKTLKNALIMAGICLSVVACNGDGGGGQGVGGKNTTPPTSNGALNNNISHSVIPTVNNEVVNNTHTTDDSNDLPISINDNVTNVTNTSEITNSTNTTDVGYQDTQIYDSQDIWPVGYCKTTTQHNSANLIDGTTNEQFIYAYGHGAKTDNNISLFIAYQAFNQGATLLKFAGISSRPLAFDACSSLTSERYPDSLILLRYCTATLKGNNLNFKAKAYMYNSNNHNFNVDYPYKTSDINFSCNLTDTNGYKSLPFYD